MQTICNSTCGQTNLKARLNYIIQTFLFLVIINVMLTLYKLSTNMCEFYKATKKNREKVV